MLKSHRESMQIQSAAGLKHGLVIPVVDIQCLTAAAVCTVACLQVPGLLRALNDVKELAGFTVAIALRRKRTARGSGSYAGR